MFLLRAHVLVPLMVLNHAGETNDEDAGAPNELRLQPRLDQATAFINGQQVATFSGGAKTVPSWAGLVADANVATPGPWNFLEYDVSR